MSELSPEVITIIMLGGFMLAVLSGYPIAISIGGLALIVGFALTGPPVFIQIYARMFRLIHNYTFLAVPLFIFMGSMLSSSGITEKLYDALYVWLSRLRGGLAVVTVLIGTILAACVGIIGASVTMLSLIALPAMLRRGYSKSLATGAVCAGGCLGILIPPSIMLIIYGPMANLSVGKLFMAAIFPGLLLSALYIAYILIRSYFQPDIGPSVPAEESTMPFVKKTKMLVTALIPPVILILAVLGAIFLGIAPPTEAAAVGALAATILAITHRMFNMKVLKEALMNTFQVTSMMLLIAAASFAFVGVFLGAGGGKVVENLLMSVPGGRWGAFATVMFIIFILGFFMDFLGILFIMVPIIAPIIPKLGFDPLWFGMMICVNFETSFMTPPMAQSIFYLKGTLRPELGVTTGDIIRGVFPFVGLIVIGLVLLVIFPQIILWLPSAMIK